MAKQVKDSNKNYFKEMCHMLLWGTLSFLAAFPDFLTEKRSQIIGPITDTHDFVFKILVPTGIFLIAFAIDVCFSFFNSAEKIEKDGGKKIQWNTKALRNDIAWALPSVAAVFIFICSFGWYRCENVVRLIFIILMWFTLMGVKFASLTFDKRYVQDIPKAVKR